MKILGEAVLAGKESYFIKAGLDKFGAVDTPTPYRMSDAVRFLDAAMSSLTRPCSVVDYQAIKWRILALRSDACYAFVFGGRLSLRDELSDILSRLVRIPVNGKPNTILDLTCIPSEVWNVVVSVLCRLAFDFAMGAKRRLRSRSFAKRHTVTHRVTKSPGLRRQRKRFFGSPRKAAHTGYRYLSSVNARQIWRQACCPSAIRCLLFG